MKREAERLYLGRKLGRGMGVRYTLSQLVPALLVVLITLVLVFALVFISSMTTAIDRMIEILGSGTVRTEEQIPPALFPQGRISHVNNGEGILYTEGGESLAYLKGVEEGYFLGEVGETIRLTEEKIEARNPIIISRTLSDRLHLAIGDRLTLLLYQSDKERTRPFLMTVTGIFDSGYAQIDKYMAYVDYGLIGGEGSYELLLPKGSNTKEALGTLASNGIWVTSYQELYAALYLNVRQSVMILYLILGAVAVLAAFFSTDIAQVYTSRDKRDIGTLRLLGLSEKDIAKLYACLTLLSVSIAAFVGTVLGLLLSLASPSIIQLVARKEPEMIENYIATFHVHVPWPVVFLMLLAMVLCSWVSLKLSLRKTASEELVDTISNG